MPEQIATVVFANVDRAVGRSSDDAIARAAALLQDVNHAVPVILCSGRTRGEVEALQQRLGLRHPFVCEHGCAAFIPREYFPFAVPDARDVAGYHAIEFGRPYEEVALLLRRLAERQRVPIVTFGDLSVEQVAQDCGLSLLDARLAKLREYGERFRFADDFRSGHRLIAALERTALRCLMGSRYHDVVAAIDPGLAVGRIYGLYKRAFGAVDSVGAVDSTAPFAGAGPAGDDGLGIDGWALGIVRSVQRLRHPDTVSR